MAIGHDWRPGVLNEKQLKALIASETIGGAEDSKIDSPVIDLHLTEIAYHMKGSVKPLLDEQIKLIAKTFSVTDKEFHKNGKFHLKKGHTYLFKLKESVSFNNTNFNATATGKSTYGRLDILTRMMASRVGLFDRAEEGKDSDLWIEITPITFPITVEPGLSLNQLRVYKGPPSLCEISQSNHKYWGEFIMDENGSPLDDAVSKTTSLSLNLNEDPVLKNNICAFVAKDVSEDNFIDLTLDFSDQSNKYNANDYWEPVRPCDPAADSKHIKIDSEKFYIMRSRERFKLPSFVAAYCQAVTEVIGEIRIHYAGFVHPYFGIKREDNKGAPLIFEVRGHNLKTLLRHEETLASLNYYFMSNDGVVDDGSYSDQELTLSKVFNQYSLD